MSRVRTAAAVCLLLFGTTFLWLMPTFQGDATPTDGSVWAVVQLGVVVTLVGFAAAAWGLHRAASWWRGATIVSATAGLVVLPLWWMAVQDVAGAPNVVANLVVHAAGVLLLLVGLLVPSVDDRIETRLQAGAR